eukprot:253879-Amorphochlora_amoeboformis.AAC.1
MRQRKRDGPQRTLKVLTLGSDYSACLSPRGPLTPHRERGSSAVRDTADCVMLRVECCCGDELFA